jgi:DNA modification methylase
MSAAETVYGKPIDGAVWVGSEARSGALYSGRHEFIEVFAIGSGSHLDNVAGRGRRLRSSVWRYPGVTWPSSVNRLQSQPVGKPVALIADVIKDTTRRGDIILDPFAAAGTAIIAAERVKRQARALEAEPRLVDVTIRRWQTATGGAARHAESGMSFEEIGR